jgi:enterochelin esterase-like enzyme
MKHIKLLLAAFSITILTTSGFSRTEKQLLVEKDNKTFKWVNEVKKDAPLHALHKTFYSKSNQVEVGYFIEFPEEYQLHPSKKYPVLYWLHGGRPGNENKGLNTSSIFENGIKQDKILPLIIVYVNGGRLSHYNWQGKFGENAFLELVEHIDKNYRSINNQSGRAVAGTSQGGRGTGRYMLKYSHMFCAAVPIFGGHQIEKIISKNNGIESEAITITPAWNNTWDLAKMHAKNVKKSGLKILVAVGSKDNNYEGNLLWSNHLDSLGIKNTLMVAPNIGHDMKGLFNTMDDHIFSFLDRAFKNH